VLLIDDGAHRVAVIRDELTRQGHLVVGVVDQALLIHDCVLRLQPDVVIVDAESPSRDTLENLAACRRPARARWWCLPRMPATSRCSRR
jgi:response regulator NasT